VRQTGCGERQKIEREREAGKKEREKERERERQRERARERERERERESRERACQSAFCEPSVRRARWIARTITQRSHDGDKAGIERVAIVVDADDVNVEHPGGSTRLYPEARERKNARTGERAAGWVVSRK
jgi:hypothetical protein